MFGYGGYDYDDEDYDRRHYFSASARQTLNRYSSSRATSSVNRPTRNVVNHEQVEKDFTQIVLGWRLSTVKDVHPEANTSSSLALNYTSRTTYYNHFLPLILEDARASVAQGLEKQGKSFSVTIKNDVNEPRDYANPWIMNLHGVIPPDQDHSASMNVLLLSHRSGKTQDMVMLVLASEISDRNEIKAKFILNSRVVDSNPRIFKAGSRWQATYVTSLVSHQRAYEACFNKAMPPCLANIVTGRISETAHYNDTEVAEYTKKLNISQQNAVQRFVATSNGITLLQGPPGTGKTTTIVQMLAALVSKGQRVLVCAPSNKAVQVLAERFVAQYSARVILAGIESKVPDVLRPIFLHTWLNDCNALLNDAAIQSSAAKGKAQFLKAINKILENVNEAKTRIDTYFNVKDEYFSQLKECLTVLRQNAESFNFSQENALTLFQEHISPRLAQLTRYKDRILAALPSGDAMETALLNNSSVIFSTLSVAGRMQMLSTDVQPVDVLIVDEAGQSVEAETLIAFQHMPDKVLLVGDTKQLPATVLSKLAKEKKYDRSMMERLEKNNAPLLRLDTQYRMHADICTWPSSRFYEGGLITSPTVSAHTNTGLTQSVAFYDVRSGKERASGTSRQNDQEAKYVVDAIRKLRETDSTSRIGVITFYAAQLEAIQALLKREAPAVKQKVTVNTVDGFQGDEREIIILSCVCSNNENDIGFLSDARRLNVAITRAKNSLIILGKATTLESSNSDLKVMIADLRQRKKCFTEQQLNTNLGNVPQPVVVSNKKTNKDSAVASNNSASSTGLFAQKNKPAKTTNSSNVASLLAPVAAMSVSNATLPPPPPVVATKKTSVCKFFNGVENSCNKGDACKFVHKT